MTPINDDYDSPWKEVLEGYLPEFFAFFFPQMHAEIDWQRGYKSLDKELQQVVREAEVGRRLADKLVQVWRHDGADAWVLIHIEVQSQPEDEFDERMFIYHYRLYDRFRRPVVSLAVLGDESATWRPDSFGYALWGCTMQFTFPVIKLRDYVTQQAALEASTNPFATVVLAHLAAQATRNAPDERAAAKFRLARRLYEVGYSRQAVIDLYRFIDWLLRLPKDLDLAVWQQLKTYEEAQRMRYITTAERYGMEMGLEQGLAQGRQEGRQEGASQGRREGLLEGIALALDIKFGAASQPLFAELRQLTDMAVIEAVRDAVRGAQTPDDVRRVYAAQLPPRDEGV